jgi:predicted nucleic acid-binding protein
MTNTVFIDTNIFVYAYDDDDPKYTQANTFLKTGLPDEDIVVSAQVLNEFYSVMSKHKFPHEKIVRAMREIIQSTSMAPLGLRTVLEATSLKERYQYSWWDSLILASALENNCTIVYSEDMKDGHVIDGVLTIRNPFQG